MARSFPSRNEHSPGSHGEGITDLSAEAVISQDLQHRGTTTTTFADNGHDSLFLPMRTLFFDEDSINQLAAQLVTTIDKVKGARLRIADRAESLTDDLRQHRQQHAEFKPCGLRGAAARQHAALGIEYNSTLGIRGEAKDRLLEVRKVEATLRKQIEGLGILQQMMDEQELELQVLHENYAGMQSILESWSAGGLVEEEQVAFAIFEEKISETLDKLSDVDEMLAILPEQL